MADEKIPKVKTPNLVDLFKKENIRLETVGIRKDRVYNSKKGIEPYAGEFGKTQKMHLRIQLPRATTHPSSLFHIIGCHDPNIA